MTGDIPAYVVSDTEEAESASPERGPAVLELDNVFKSYGDVAALEGLSMSVQPGEVYGFLGRNGAGKSTTLQIIMGITLATRGEVRFFGKPLSGSDQSPRTRIGYVAQEQHFYDWMTAERLGRFVSGFYPSWDNDEFVRLLNLLEVPVDRRILGFSGGMRAKLALSLALAHRPDLLLLDEPTAGMDAVSRREFIDIVREQAVSAGRTTLFSSHYIDEVEQAATSIGIIDDGRMQFEGSLASLRSSVLRWRVDRDELNLQPPVLPLGAEALRDESGPDHWQYLLRVEPVAAESVRAELGRTGFVQQPSLEDIFVGMVTRQVTL